MASIGDLFFLFRGDDGQLQVDAAKAGDTAGAAAGKRYSVSMGTALRGRASAARSAGRSARVSPSAVKGGAELNAAVTQFAADTGATTEEAAKAQSTIGELFRTNLQSFGEIGGTLAVLRTDLGLTQDAADQAAQSYLDFAQVAGGTGAEAAGRFDDLLASLNLDASKAPGIMDQLVASHQKYGESINANIDALTAMAPALNAANLTVDDGVGLLNMFASAGVDAAAAPAALSKAPQEGQEPRRAPDAHRPDQRHRGPVQAGPAGVRPVRREGRPQARPGARPGQDRRLPGQHGRGRGGHDEGGGHDPGRLRQPGPARHQELRRCARRDRHELRAAHPRLLRAPARAHADHHHGRDGARRASSPPRSRLAWRSCRSCSSGRSSPRWRS